MLGTKPTSDIAIAPYHLATATREMMWTCALATARLTVASGARGLELWSNMLRTPFAPAAWPGLASATGLGRPSAAVPAIGASPAAAIEGGDGRDAAPFARYRSASGHATAQVIFSK